MVDPTIISAYAAPALVVIGGARWLAGWLWKRFEAKLNDNRAHYDERNLQVLNELQLVRVQTTATNGRVSRLEIQAAKLEGAVFGTKLIDAKKETHAP